MCVIREGPWEETRQPLSLPSKLLCVRRGTCLRGTDDRLPRSVAAPDHHLLSKEDLLCRNLNAQITTGHHDPIAGFQDLIKPDREGGKTGYGNSVHRTVMPRDSSWDSALAVLLQGQDAVTMMSPWCTEVMGCASLLSPPKAPGSACWVSLALGWILHWGEGEVSSQVPQAHFFSTCLL